MAAKRDSWRRKSVHALEAAAAGVFYWSFWLLPVDAASGLGGWIGRTIGPRLRASARAERNLTRAFPEMTAAEIAPIVCGMWENLGRTAGEYPHLGKFKISKPGGPADPRIEIAGGEHIEHVRAGGKAAIFVSGHFANWELPAISISQHDVPLDIVYREASNKLTGWLYRRRDANVSGNLIPKGAAGARQMLKSLQAGRHLGIMADQKMNDGIAVPFFGRDAMTAPALAQLALKYDCPVVPVRIERTKGARFRISFLAPIEFAPTGERNHDTLAFMTKINEQLETWIRNNPAQWLWLHNRWPD